MTEIARQTDAPAKTAGHESSGFNAASLRADMKSTLPAAKDISIGGVVGGLIGGVVVGGIETAMFNPELVIPSTILGAEIGAAAGAAIGTGVAYLENKL
jgi:hypothetical protein